MDLFDAVWTWLLPSLGTHFLVVLVLLGLLGWAVLVFRTSMDQSRQARAAELANVAAQHAEAMEELARDGGNQVGAVHTLEQIACIRADYRDRILATLVEFLRKNAKKEPINRSVVNTDAKNVGTADTKDEATKNTKGVVIRVILRVLGGQLEHPKKRHGEDAGDPVDLSMLDLKGVEICGAHFPNCSFARSDLSEARGVKASFTRADMRSALLEDSDFKGADFKGADLSKATLKWAHLSGANFKEVNFDGANLEGCMALGADFKGANFRGANLTGADLSKSNLKGACFFGANLERTILEECKYNKNTFRGAANRMVPDNEDIDRHEQAAKRLIHRVWKPEERCEDHG